MNIPNLHHCSFICDYLLCDHSLLLNLLYHYRACGCGSEARQHTPIYNVQVFVVCT